MEISQLVKLIKIQQRRKFIILFHLESFSVFEECYQELAKCDPELASRLSPHDATRVQRGLEIFRATQKKMSSFLFSHNIEYTNQVIKRQRKGEEKCLLACV